MTRMWMLTDQGPREVDATPEEASLIGHHWNAVQDFLGGRPHNLGDFDPKTAGGEHFGTGEDVILDWWMTGELAFDEIY